MTKPWSHIDNHPLLLAMEHEFNTVPETVSAREDWQKIVDMVRQSSDTLHAEAAMVMHEYNVTKRPFGLFLRNFDIEAYNYLTPESDREQRKVITTLRGPGEIEQKLAAAFAGHIPLIGVANPSDLMANSSIPKVTLPNEGWQEVVKSLIAHSHIIIMECQNLAPGVMWELNAILEEKREDDTVVIVPPAGSDGNRGDAIADLLKISNAVIEERESPYLHHPRLSVFKRKAYEDEIDFGRLDKSPLFSDLLATAAKLAAEAPPFDAKQHATWINNQGVKQLNEQKFTEAWELFSQSLLIRRHINDRPGILTSYMNFGILNMDANQANDALPYFFSGLELANELDQKIDQGLLMSYIGVSFREMGKYDEARKWLLNAYRLQYEFGTSENVENTVLQLADIYRSEQNGDGMVDCYKELRSYYRERQDILGELRANLNLAATFFQAGLLHQTATICEEGLRLSRQIGDTESERLCTSMLQRIRQEIGPER